MPLKQNNPKFISLKNIETEKDWKRGKPFIKHKIQDRISNQLNEKLEINQTTKNIQSTFQNLKQNQAFQWQTLVPCQKTLKA